MDAYDGTMTFYAADPTDPILRAYAGVFPGAVPAAGPRCPTTLRPHLRVPEEQFNVQTRVFATYHVTQPETFFQRTDLWTVPTDAGSEQSLADRGVLRRDADARRARRRVPAAAADGAAAAGRT